jgi:DtxR family Mn-dependent transcriptional regulator
VDLDEKAEEVLETLWIKTEEGHQKLIPVAEIEEAEESALKQLLDNNLISLHDDKMTLTEEGHVEATSIVRRHRLAERLLADVLDTHDMLIHEKACKFEHILDKGLDDAICTLLGHPRVCPHGSAIPPGPCCTGKEEETKRVVASLAEINPGDKGKIAYIYAPRAKEFQKLITMGVLPGAPIKLLQRSPSYVFEVRHTQFAVDMELAESIYIRLAGSDEPQKSKRSEHGKKGGRCRKNRWGWWRRR